ncbi:MAG TPA: 2-oxoglutarate dehydrogenase complex dihydrolipoyllysine-residue succinyltransferase [Thermomicrobiales bacterium]|nr:2-oxoglutarate dehydrogenase complex dihydrolipoyllysine-residue succinyltransferase [Thermomicrobiales bacterium]
MPVEIRVPPLGESLVDAVVGQWLKAEGDSVSRGETLVELETDKVNLDVAAAEDGVLSRIDKREGDVVTVGEILGIVGASDGATASNGAQAAVAAQATAPEADATTDSAPLANPADTAAVPPAQPALVTATVAPAESAVDGGGRAAPAVRRLAEEHNVDVNTIPGTGPGGRVTREDILAYTGRQTAPAPTPVSTPQPTPVATPVAAVQPSPQPLAPSPSSDGRREERIRMNRRRQTIAARLVEAQNTAAMLTTFNEIDMTAVMELRKARKESFQERHGVGLGFMSFFTKAVVGALKAFPKLNAEIQGDEIVLKHYYDIGIAVGLEEGLVVPVVRDADRKTFAEIEKEIIDLATRARENKLALQELLGGTFSITNGGIFGSLMSTPILNAPQVGILGMHAIQQRPVARNSEVVIRPMMYVALSYDHRIVDGSEAVRFLVRVKELVEDPTTLLLEG